jgi:hypothetical protein
MRPPIVVVSAFPPLSYNCGAPTALLYYTLAHAPDPSDIHLYYFNEVNIAQPLIDQELGSLPIGNARRIHSPCRRPDAGLDFGPHNYRLTESPMPVDVQVYAPPASVLEEINALRPATVWLYPHWLIGWVEHLACPNIVVSGMDCATLHFERALCFGTWNSGEDLAHNVSQLARNMHLEKQLGHLPVKVHFVGEQDLNRYQVLTRNQEQAVFLRHPHYRYVEVTQTLREKSGKLTIAITGGGKTVYVGNHLERLIGALVGSAPALRDGYDFLFIGRDYETYAAALERAGYAVTHHLWEQAYNQLLASCQIQIFPIAVGTGTKGKVLHALATGLLTIGSAVAYENVAVDERDVLWYQEPEEVAGHLAAIRRHRSKYAQMAENSSRAVRLHHSPQATAGPFWEYALGTGVILQPLNNQAND